MKLEGIHHVTCVTGDAPRNLDFYTRVLGLRMVKKTVNQDDPTVYHLFYADELGSPGADLTFFEYPDARPGRAGAGMIHRIVCRVGSEDAIDFWAGAARTGGDGGGTRRSTTTLRRPRRARPRARSGRDERTSRSSPTIPRSQLSLRCRASTACARTPSTRSPAGAPSSRRSASSPARTAGRCARADRDSFYAYDEPPPEARRRRRRHGPPRRLVVDDGRSRGVARARRPGGPAARRRSSTASGFARSTSASRAACCSRSPRWGRASRRTSRSSTSASRSCSRRPSSTCATASSEMLTPLEYSRPQAPARPRP